MNSMPTIPPLATFRAGPTQSKTVLVVDDFEPICDLVARHLSADGYRVLTANDAVEAQKIIESGVGPQIDLLLTEDEMPGLSGAELAEWFVRQRPEAKVLLMSRCENLPESKRRACLQKPFSWETLGAAVRQAWTPHGIAQN